MRSGLGFKRLDMILLTHGHLDHILGLGGIAATMARWGNLSQLTIHGGRWALERVQALMNVVLRGDEVDLEVRYVSLQAGPILADEYLRITAVPVSHRGPGNFGFVFEEPAHRPFLADRAAALDIPAGPERRRLVQGEAVCLRDGRTIHPDEVLGPAQEGTKLAYIGDAARGDNLVEVVRGADALVIEATYLSADAELAHQFGHLTALEAARLARDAQVGHLYLTHVSQRYSTAAIYEEASATFPAVTVAADMDRFVIKRREP
jgi:ribonuclease Z